MRFVSGSFFITSFILLSLVRCAGGGLDKGGHIRQAGLIPSATLVYSEDYKVLGRADGQSSTLLFLGFLPVTKPLDIEYAMSQAVQKVEGGQSMVNVEIWHETHYYFPIGAVSVVRVEGDVVSFTKGKQPLFEKSTKPTASGGITVGGKKKKRKNTSGGITVGGSKK